MKSLINSFKFAFFGIKYAIKHERNFRIHLTFIYYLILFSYFAKITENDTVILVISCGLVLTTELFNTAIELVCDKDGNDYNIFVKYAKDVAAAAVLVQAFVSIIICIVVFLPKISTILEHLNIFWLISILTSLPLAVLFIFKGEKE